MSSGSAQRTAPGFGWCTCAGEISSDISLKKNHSSKLELDNKIEPVAHSVPSEHVLIKLAQFEILLLQRQKTALSSIYFIQNVIQNEHQIQKMYPKLKYT